MFWAYWGDITSYWNLNFNLESVLVDDSTKDLPFEDVFPIKSRVPMLDYHFNKVFHYKQSILGVFPLFLVQHPHYFWVSAIRFPVTELFRPWPLGLGTSAWH